MISDTPKTDEAQFMPSEQPPAFNLAQYMVKAGFARTLERENAALRGWSKAQLDELHRISEALGTNDGHSSVTHIEILKEENAALREQLAAHLDWPKEPSDKMIRAGLRIMASDGALSAVSDIYEAMRLAHIKEKGK